MQRQRHEVYLRVLAGSGTNDHALHEALDRARGRLEAVLFDLGLIDRDMRAVACSDPRAEPFLRALSATTSARYMPGTLVEAHRKCCELLTAVDDRRTFDDNRRFAVVPDVGMSNVGGSVGGVCQSGNGDIA